MTVTTLGLVGAASMVFTSCRAPEVSIPAGNGQGGGGGAASAGVPLGGADGTSDAGGAAPATDAGVGGMAGGGAGTGGQGGASASSGAGGSAGSAGGQGGAPAVTGGASGTATGGRGGATGVAPTTGSATGGHGADAVGTGGVAPIASGGATAASGGQTGTGQDAAGGMAGHAVPADESGGATGISPSGSGGPSTRATTGPGGAGGATLTFVTSDDAAGAAITLSLDGALTDPAGDFNVPLGSNGRACSTCHLPDQSMSLTPAGAQARFDATAGADPLFRPVDGAVSPLADVSTTDARRTAYALLLSRGLIRVGLPIPASADFDLVAVADPYGYASAIELSLFRRPLPAANLPFLSTVMWDGREGLVTRDDPTNTLLRALASQAGDAVLGHAQATSPLAPSRIAGIVGFEMSIFSAQATNLTAGPLNGASGLGGPLALTQQTFYPGINDPNGADPMNPFAPNVFTMYTPWQAADPQGDDADARRQIARGEDIFNTRSFSVSGVAGLTTASQPTMVVTCGTCHDAPGAGSNSTGRFFDLGLASASRAGTDLPVYTLQERSTGAQVQVSDPGRALITGAFKDVATFKVPTLRGLAARAPYFHNGSAATLSGVVGFYNGRFGIGLSSDEKAALAAFLSSL